MGFTGSWNCVLVEGCCTSAGVSTSKSFVGAADVGLDQSPTMSRLALAGDDLRRGAWTAEEDEKLRAYVAAHGTGHWRSVGRKAGLQRCGKSCRLRWTNYLRPNIRHGSFTPDEEDLIVKLHSSLGSRWSLIAAKMPGRTDNDIKNHWNTRLKKKLCNMGIDPVTHKPISELLRDIAGTMDGSAGNPMMVAAGEEARRCFSDNLLRKAVRDYTRTSSAPGGQSKYDSISCAATDFNLVQSSDPASPRQPAAAAADHCDVSAIAHSSLIQNEAAEDLHSWDRSITSTSNCNMAGHADNSACSEEDAAVDLSRSNSRSPSRSTMQNLVNCSPSRSSKNNMQQQGSCFRAAIISTATDHHHASCDEVASCRQQNLIDHHHADAAISCPTTPAGTFHLPAASASSSKENLMNPLEMGSQSSSCTDNPDSAVIKEMHEISRQFLPAASGRTSWRSSNSQQQQLVRPALHFLPDSTTLPCWRTLMNTGTSSCTTTTSATAAVLDELAVPSCTSSKHVPSRFSTESNLLQIKRQLQPFNFPEADTTHFSHSMDFKRPHLMDHPGQDHHHHHVLSSSRSQYNNSNPAAGFTLQASHGPGSELPGAYLSLREPLSPTCYTPGAAAAAATGAITPPAQLVSSFAAGPFASFGTGPSISSFLSAPTSGNAGATGMRIGHHYDLQSPRVVLWDFQE